MTGASKAEGIPRRNGNQDSANPKIPASEGFKDTELDEGLDNADWKAGKRPFLKRGSGLFRFYKNGQCTSAEKAKRKSLTDRGSSNSPENVQHGQETRAQDEEANYSDKPVLICGNETPNRKRQGTNRNNTAKSVHFEKEILTPEESFISEGRQEEEDDLHLFEALEKAAGTSSFCSTSSLAARFLQMKLSAENDEAKGNTECESMFSDAMSSTISSLHDSDDDDLESHNDDVIVINDEDLHVLKEQLEKTPTNIPPKVHVTEESTNSAAILRENLELKSRIKFMEDKMEKITLEWWAYKDQMMEVLHGMQSKLTKVELETESSQTLLMKKIETLEAEIRAKSQKWCESQVEVVEKTQILEEEQKFATQKWEKSAKKLQKGVDGLQLELGRKFLETTASIQVMNEKYERLVKEREKAITPLIDPSLCDPPINLIEPRSGTTRNQSNEAPSIDRGIVQTLVNGDTEVTYQNGTKKIISRDESEVRHIYTNGDIRVLLKDGTIKYYYADSSTWHTTYSSGAEFFEFANGQTERRNPNGMVETVYPNGCVKYTHPTGTEECIFADNTVLRLNPNGEKEIVLPNGQQEIHAPDYKKRIYPDGTYKIVYNDGSQETRYPNGRVRIKNDKGVLMADVTVKSKPDKL